MSYITTATGKHFVGRIPDGDDRKLVFEIDDRMLSKEFHELMPEDIDDSYLQLVSDVKCEEKRPMLSTMNS